jgi:hypothetical protein
LKISNVALFVPCSKEAAMQDTDFLILSRAVRQWYRYYDVDPDKEASRLLNHAAVRLFDQGHRSVEGIASVLIETYVGPWPSSVNMNRSPDPIGGPQSH